MAVVTYTDRRDTLNRLARIGITGSSAQGWLPVLDPVLVHQWSDRQLAAFIAGGGVVPGGGGAYGSGPYGSGPYGG